MKDKKSKAKKDLPLTPEQVHKRNYDNAPDWMKNNPDNKKEITHDGKEYWWCPLHKLFQRHKPEECRLKQQKAAGGKEAETPAGGTKPKAGLKLTTHLATIQDQAKDIDWEIE